MHRLLKLQHHKHTGKLLHHRHTSYRALLLILLLAGTVLVYVTRQASADSFTVYAKVPAPIPTQPAVILRPATRLRVQSPSITVDGTCPVTTPSVAVVITEDSSPLGSAACSSGGSFSAQVMITVGTHTLLPRTLTITGDKGPDGPPVDITYDAPAVPASTSSQSSSSSTPAAPLSLQNDKPFILFGPNQTAKLTANFIGGQAPYAATIDWGDTAIDVFKNLNAGWHSFSHRYKIIAPWTVRVKTTDVLGANISISVAALTAYVPPVVNNLLTTSIPGGSHAYTVVALYSAYGSLICIVGVLWLHAHRLGYAHAMVPTRGRPARPRKR